MSRLNPAKLHTRFAGGIAREGPLSVRRYTLTHSDRTGDLFLTIAPEVDREQLSGWYTRLMRDEVVAEWEECMDGPSLHVFCYVGGRLALGGSRLRYGIFQRELSLVLEAIRFGDGKLFEGRPELERAPIWVHFHSTDRRYDKTEYWGTPGDYRA